MSDFRIQTYVVGAVGTNCYMVYHETSKEAVIVDPGDDSQYLQSCVQKLGLVPQAILLTHGHFDHMLAANELKQVYQIPIYACEVEAALLADVSLNLSDGYVKRPTTVVADRWLKDREKFSLAGFQWEMIATPGHTSGSCCYYIPDEQVLLSGDTLFQQSYGRVDFATSNTEDMIHSVVQVLFELPDDVIVYPGHMGATTLEFEKSHNPLSIVYKGRKH